MSLIPNRPKYKGSYDKDELKEMILNDTTSVRIPRDIGNIILSFGYFCELCATFQIGNMRKCYLCYPGRQLCQNCFFHTGLQHLTCLSCGNCGNCDCSIHPHGWYVQWGSPIVIPHGDLEETENSDEDLFLIEY